MSWQNWKLVCFIAALFAVFGHLMPHVEPLASQYGPTTVFSLSVSGGHQQANVTAGMYKINNHPWLTK